MSLNEIDQEAGSGNLTKRHSGLLNLTDKMDQTTLSRVNWGLSGDWPLGQLPEHREGGLRRDTLCEITFHTSTIRHI